MRRRDRADAPLTTNTGNTRSAPERQVAAAKAGLGIVTELGDRFCQVVALNRLGRIRDALHHTDAAQDAFQQAAGHLTAADRTQAAAVARANADSVVTRQLAAAHAAAVKADDDRFERRSTS